MNRFVVLATLAAACSMPASAQQRAMQDDPRIRQGFHDFYMAREIEDKCPSIDLRRLAALGFYNSMTSYARSAGYTRADFKALEDNDVVKDAFKAELRAELAARGAQKGNAAGYCQVGQEEIARGTQAGKLLQVN